MYGSQVLQNKKPSFVRKPFSKRIKPKKNQQIMISNNDVRPKSAGTSQKQQNDQNQQKAFRRKRGKSAGKSRETPNIGLEY